MSDDLRPTKAYIDVMKIYAIPEVILDKRSMLDGPFSCLGNSEGLPELYGIMYLESLLRDPKVAYYSSSIDRGIELPRDYESPTVVAALLLRSHPELLPTILREISRRQCLYVPRLGRFAISRPRSCSLSAHRKTTVFDLAYETNMPGRILLELENEDAATREIAQGIPDYEQLRAAMLALGKRSGEQEVRNVLAELANRFPVSSRIRSLLSDPYLSDHLDEAIAGIYKIISNSYPSSKRLQVFLKTAGIFGRALVPLTLRPSRRNNLVIEKAQGIMSTDFRSGDLKADFFLRLYPIGAFSIHLSVYVGIPAGLSVDDIINIGRHGHRSIWLKHGNERITVDGFFKRLRDCVLGSILKPGRIFGPRAEFTHTLVHLIDPKHVLSSSRQEKKALYGIATMSRNWRRRTTKEIDAGLKLTTDIYDVIDVTTSAAGTLAVHDILSRRKTWRRVRMQLRDVLELVHVRKMMIEQMLPWLGRANDDMFSVGISARKKARKLKSLSPVDLDAFLSCRILSRDITLPPGYAVFANMVENALSLQKIAAEFGKELEISSSLIYQTKPAWKTILDKLANPPW